MSYIKSWTFICNIEAFRGDFTTVMSTCRKLALNLLLI